MKTELQNELIEKYPKIFADINKKPTESLMCFGCECGDGWYELINSLCNALQNTTDEYKEPQVVAFQVKEKFGTLRFYCNGTTDMQYSLIGMAENLSSKICEQCGSMANVKLRGHAWLTTLCDTCNDKRSKTKTK